LGDKLPADSKGPLEDSLAEAKKVLENESASGEDLNAAKDKLMEVLQSMGTQVYQDAAAAGGETDGDASDATGGEEEDDEAKSDAPSEEDVVEADFEVVDEEKKED
jgi:molecular chaperone DnaK